MSFPDQPTNAFLQTASHLQPQPVEQAPLQIGRYVVARVMGKGGFGVVLEATDPQLNRRVAIKVPCAKWLADQRAIEQFLREARILAEIEHPHVLPVYDYGSTPEIAGYLVSKYVEGGSLAQLLARRRVTIEEALDFTRAAAEALAAAHRKRIVHRDVKPGNLLLDGKHLYLADFGLAMREWDPTEGLEGTFAYMSPEQAAGEGHRIDSACDLFSLGIVLYEMLTGRRPFDADSNSHLLKQIQEWDPTPPRFYNSEVTPRVEKICLRCLEKRARDRYPSADELASDLRACLSPPSPAPAGISPEQNRPKVVPKGLRGFDEGDSDFFLQLLPGPQHADGLPDSVHVWKERIEATDNERAFAVAAFYGPSGSGKSSFLRAGLLPRLSRNVSVVYASAQPVGMERRLEQLVRQAIPVFTDESDLAEILRDLRKNPERLGGRKLLLVIDQFEQWLQAAVDLDSSPLVKALRQCDGRNLACLLVVRDDFWMAVTRLFKELEISLDEGRTCGGIDLFQERHARSVLTEFGRAYGALPARPEEMTPAQREFIREAVAALSSGGKVVCLRLAVLSQMLQDQEWSPATLQRFHGLQGLGVSFLETLFDPSSAPPAWRRLKQGARVLLATLLSEESLDLRGPVRSDQELRERLETEAPSVDFTELLNVLVRDLKLIAPVDPHGEQMSTRREKQPAKERFYQLTHDFLVPAIREWVRGDRVRTWRGRAELHLDELSRQWQIRPSPQRLPQVNELLTFLALTSARRRSPTQQRFLNAALRHYALYATVWALIALVLLGGTIVYRQALLRQEFQLHAQQLLIAPSVEIPARVESLADRHAAGRWANERQASSERPLRWDLLLWRLEKLPTERLWERLLVANADEFEAALPVLRTRPAEFAKLDSVSADQGPAQLVRWAALDAALGRRKYTAAGDYERIAAWLTQESLFELPVWSRLLARYADELKAPLSATCRAGETRGQQRTAAATLLATWFKEDVEIVARLALDMHPSDTAAVLPTLFLHGEKAADFLSDLENVAEKRPWPGDLPLSPAPEDLSRLFRAAGGALRESYGWFWRLPAGQLTETLQQAQAAGYRPVTLRPYSGKDGGELFCGAFQRDGVRSAYHRGLTSDSVRARNAELAQDGMVLADLSAERRGTEARWTALWREKPEGVTDSAFYLDVPEAEHEGAWRPLNEAGFVPLLNLKEHLAGNVKDGRYSSVRWKCRSVSAFVDEWEAPEKRIQRIALPGWTQTDLRLSSTTKDQPLYAAAWWNNAEHETQFLAECAEEEHASAAVKMEQKGFRPSAVAVRLPKAGEPQLASLWRRHVADSDDGPRQALHAARAAIFLFFLGRPNQLTSALAADSDPTLRGLTLHGLAEYRVPIEKIIALLEATKDEHVQAGLLLSLTLQTSDEPPVERRRNVIRRFLTANAHTDPYLTSAAQALARHWRVESSLVIATGVQPRQFVNGQGQRFVRVVGTDETIQGAPASDRERDPAIEFQHRVSIPRDYYLLEREVTVEQYLRFRPSADYAPNYSPTADCPINMVSWIDAAAYCRWLSEQEGVPPEQMCYPPVADIETGAILPGDFLARTGYRLPTEAEWEHACRAGAQSPRPFGDRISLLPHYAWTAENSRFVAHPTARKLPNDRGLFDLLGNVMEWCHDPYQDYPRDPERTLVDTGRGGLVIEAGQARVIRGGAFLYAPSTARSSQRYYVSADRRVPYMGFRVARTLPPQ